MYLHLIIPGAALVIQLIALFFAGRLLRYTENRMIGFVLVVVIFLMSFRRFISLHRYFNQGSVAVDLFAETVALSISLLILLGITLVISLLKSAEEDRRNSKFTETLYRTLFDQSPDGVLLMNGHGEILEFNDATHLQLGYTREEFKNLRIADIDPVESPEEIRASIEKVMQAGKAQFEVKHRTKEGEDRDVLVIIQTLEISCKTYFQTIWRDITERKQAEKALKESEDKFRSIFEEATDGIMIGDAKAGRHLQANKAMRAMLGYSQEEMVNFRIEDFHRKEDQRAIRKIFEKQARGEIALASEIPMLRKDGTLFYADINTSRLTLGGKECLIGIFRDITARKKAEEELRNFQMAVGSATDAISMATPEGRHYYQNEAFDKLFGFSVREVEGLTGPPSTLYADEKTGREIFATITAGGSYKGEVKMIGKDREEKDIYLRAYAIKDRQGKVTALVGTHTDITERKRNEEKLKKSEQQLLESQKVAHLGSWDLDILAGRLEWSAETYRLFDQSPEDYEPSHDEFARLVHPDDRETILTNFERALASDAEPYHVAVRIINDTGRQWMMEAYGVVRRDQAGKPLSIFGTAQDITARKKAEERILRNEEFIRNILDTVDEGFIVVDRDYRILTANSGYCGQVGDTADNIIGSHCYQVSHKIDRPCFEEGEECAVRQVFASGEPHTALHHHTDGEGNLIYVETKAYPVKDRTGNVISVIETLNNITEKHLLEDERLKSQKLESIGTLAGGIAHDFNNLLQGIFGFISMARMSYDQKDLSLSLLDQAEEALQLSVNLTNQLLTFSKGGKPVKKLIRILPVVENAVKFALSGSNTGYVLNAEEGLWQADADEGQLAQVIQNVVLNADQAMAGGGTVRVGLSNADLLPNSIIGLPAGGRFVRISIRDTGIGISVQNQARIFDPYFTTKQKGSGLGLATSYSIIKNHGGTIEVTSQVDEGTTFTIYIPALRQTKKPPALNENVCETRKGRILLMDDEEMIRNVAEAMIGSLGHEIVCVEDGRRAIALLKEENEAGRPFDLVILDLTVRAGMGGEEALRLMKEIDPGLKAVVSSGYADSPVVADYLAYGFSAVLNKPYQLKALRYCLSRFLQG